MSASGVPARGVLPTNKTTRPFVCESVPGRATTVMLAADARQVTTAADSDRARDLVQDTFLRAARSPHSIPASHEEAWLVRVLVNIKRDQWRRDAARKRIDPEGAADTARAESSGQEQALIAKMTVWRALERIAPRRRAVIVMHELEGLAVPAIAKLLGISGVTVRWHLSVGRAQLASAIESKR